MPEYAAMAMARHQAEQRELRQDDTTHQFNDSLTFLDIIEDDEDSLAHLWREQAERQTRRKKMESTSFGKSLIWLFDKQQDLVEHPRYLKINKDVQRVRARFRA